MDINNNFTSINKTNTFCSCDNYNNNITIISSISEYNDKILVCWEQKSNNAYFKIYNTKENKFEVFKFSTNVIQLRN